MGTETTSEQQNESAHAEEDRRVICPACDGSCWSRSARGRCLRCKGTGLILPATLHEESLAAPSVLPPLGPQPVIYRGPQPPHIARAVLVAQRDARELGGAVRRAVMLTADGNVRYADAEELISLGGDVLLPLGVAASVANTTPNIELSEGAVRRLTVTLWLSHPESGEVWEAERQIAVAWDQEHTLSQAENAAATVAFATWLVHTLAIPRGYRSVHVVERERQSAAAEAAPKPEKPPARDLVAEAQAAIAGAQTVAELEHVAKRVRREFTRSIRRGEDQVALNAAIEERRLRVSAKDAHGAAEGPQGRAA